MPTDRPPGNSASTAAHGGIITAAFVAIFAINTLGQFAVYSMKTLTGPFADALGAAPQLVGIVSSLFAVTAMAFKLVSAPAIDAFNRKWVLVFALSILLLACLFDAFAASIPMLMIGRLLSGVALAFLPTVCFVIVSDILPPSRISTGMGYYTLSTVAVQALAPGIGLKLSTIYGFNAAFAFVCVILVGTILFVLTMRFDSPRARQPFRLRPENIFSKAVLVPTFILLIEAMIWSQIDAFLVLFGATRGVPRDQFGAFFTVLALVLVVSRPSIGYLADRFGSSRMLFGSMVFLAASYLTISWSAHLPMFLTGAVMAAFGYAGCQPSLMAVCMRLSTPERRGAASCTAYMGQDIGNLLGGVTGGALVQAFGYAAMWRLMLAPLVVAAVVVIIYRRQIDANSSSPVSPH